MRTCLGQLGLTRIWTKLKKFREKRPIRDLPYEKRLQELLLPSMFDRRERGDMIQRYKILNKKDRVDSAKLLPLNKSEIQEVTA